MREFDIEFEVNQKFTYKMSVEANTPEEALAILKEDGFDTGEAEEDIMLESYDDLSEAKVVGERITTEDGLSSRRVDLP